MSAAESTSATLSDRTLAQGAGWQVTEVTCNAGPADRPYEEQHGWFSVAAVVNGTFGYRSSTGSALMTPGSVLLGSAGTCFECGHAHSKGDRCVAFQFAPDMFEAMAGEMQGIKRAEFKNVRIPPVERLVPMFAQIEFLLQSPDALLAEELALRLATEALALDQDATDFSPNARDEARIATAVRFIEANHCGPLTIAGMASEAGMGRRRFATVFHQVVGLSPYSYVLQLRLGSAARRLLQEDRTSVLQIALDVGFGDLSEFTRRFHQHFSKPPGQYRRDRSRRRRLRHGS